MTIDTSLVTWLAVAAIVLAALAVVIDRINFPQKPFRPKRIETAGRGAARDRTGAHIVDLGSPEPQPPSDTGHGSTDGRPWSGPPPTRPPTRQP